MNREEIGEFLYRFYRKRTSSFLANIYKASITADSKDIHRARLDVKNIFALYGLFEMLDSAAFKENGGYKLFRPLYRQAGKIREIQVNYLLLSNPQPAGVELPAFILWLNGEERLAVKRFLQLVKKFRDPELAATEKRVQKICSSSTIFKMRSKTLDYVKTRAMLVGELQLNEPGEKEIHKIRQHLKTMAMITTIVYSIKPLKQLDVIISELNKTEMMIGDWHDRVVLKDAIERFLAENSPDPKELNSLKRLIQELLDYNQNLVQHFMPEVSRLVQSITEDEN